MKPKQLPEAKPEPPKQLEMFTCNDSCGQFRRGTGPACLNFCVDYGVKV